MALPSFPLLAFSSLAVLCLYRFIIHPLLFHPLKHIPSAHWSIPIFGDLWITYQRYMERNNAVTYAAHLKHGTVVRMGANELSVNCVENGIKTIYAGGWEKHAWYPQRFGSYGVVNMFSTIHHGPHSQKKRTMANVYSKTYIASSRQVAANSHALFSTRILPLLQDLSQSGEPTDVHDLHNAIAMDFMSAYQFGLSAGTNFTQDLAQRRHILHQYHCRRDYEFFSAEAPWLKKLTRTLGLQVVPYFVDQANVLLEDWNAGMCRAADKYLAGSDNNTLANPGDEPVVYKQFKTGITKLREKDPNAGKAVGEVTLPTTRHENLHTNGSDTTTAEIYSEMLDQIGAGHETSAIALTYLSWEMSKNPSLQDQLRQEVLGLTPPIKWPLPAGSDPAKDFKLPDPKQIDALPLLHAIVMETLRLHAPIPGIEPRISPNVPGGNTLGPYSNIPGGVRVSAMPYTLHRNPVVFPNPETFTPTRWLPSHTSEEQLKEMHRWFWAFGSGGRMCIGSHLATQEIKLLVASIYSNWRTEIVDDDGIEEVDAYTTKPRRNRLDLRFRHV
ncbi:cytochrome P450 [Cladophialophora carrionii]|uniref:Cytochrome P450 n=1 Tax=Cladophialophora carrionii TaxID=86049 RepID=A0A1C1CI69_9EURO|nr:cytochrome P450 [Cladophialophora carrionii]